MELREVDCESEWEGKKKGGGQRTCGNNDGLHDAINAGGSEQSGTALSSFHSLHSNMSPLPTTLTTNRVGHTLQLTMATRPLWRKRRPSTVVLILQNTNNTRHWPRWKVTHEQGSKYVY